MAKQEVKVPDIGDVESAEVIEILVAAGDSVELEQGLVTLESDKASVEVPSSASGTVVEVCVKEGDEVSEGSLIAIVDVEGDSAEEEDGGDSSEADDTTEEQGGEESASAAVDEPDTPSEKSGKNAGGKEEPRPSGSDEDSAVSERIVEVPDLGTDDAVDLIELSVAKGDEVSEGDSLAVLESDKASMEVPAPFGGKVLEILVAEGDQVKTGDRLMKMAVSGGTAESGEKDSAREADRQPDGSDQKSSSQERTEQQERSEQEAGEQSRDKGLKKSPAEDKGAAEEAGGDVYAGPAVRKLARELGVGLRNVKGSGPNGRIIKDDVQNHVREALRGGAAGASTVPGGIPGMPEVDFSAFGPVSEEPLDRIARVTAANMQRSWLNVPHVTQFDDADITELEAFRRELKDEASQREVKLTPIPFILKACAAALREHPRFNTSLTADGMNLVQKDYVHIGMAVDTPAGLLVPVVRDVDRKSLWELAEEIADLAERARRRKLKPEEMRGGCFSISSLGAIGGTGFTPIVNAPEVAILGVSKASVRPVWDGASFEPRTLLPLALSYDHRVINGGDGGRFMSYLVQLLGDIRRLLL